MDKNRMQKLAGINEGILQSNEIWRIDELHHGYAILNSKGEYVVEPQDQEGRYGAIEDKEHAQLIAAAPEMYGILNDLADIVHDAVSAKALTSDMIIKADVLQKAARKVLAKIPK